ncbi:hypothetical protein PEDI_10530 [Persicobacter diffluens]|uniref:Uncharacterized protein n=1 Tax=Persicobacter diffluens TaxID=981 RepID=A0AAN4VV30_9BACT|nr:hypothetical protein PEDI_10530 [Persicobacter diffluens]
MLERWHYCQSSNLGNPLFAQALELEQYLRTWELALDSVSIMRKDDEDW